MRAIEHLFYTDGVSRHPHTLDWDAWQKVLNELWPPKGVARSLRDVPAEHQIDVFARVVFDVDGEQLLEGTATRWTRQHVCVRVDDPRMQTAYVWLAPSDVTRRLHPGGERTRPDVTA